MRQKPALRSLSAAREHGFAEILSSLDWETAAGRSDGRRSGETLRLDHAEGTRRRVHGYRS